MSGEIKVTIGVPVYNGAPFLDDCLRSLINQTYRNIEIIISDNNSSDDTHEMCVKYSSMDSRIRYVRQRTNIGSIKNFKFLAKQAKGEYFMWAGADDILDLNWIESLLKISVQHKCLAFGVVQYIDQAGNCIDSAANKILLEFNGGGLSRQIKYIYTPWLYGKMILCWGLFPKDKLIRVINESFDKRWGGSVDIIFVFNVLRMCNVVSQKEVVLKKRNHKASESSINAGASRGRSKKRYANFLKSCFNVPFFFKFMGEMSLAERVILLVSFPLFYPLYVLRSCVHLSLYKVKSSSFIGRYLFAKR